MKPKPILFSFIRRLRFNCKYAMPKRRQLIYYSVIFCKTRKKGIRDSCSRRIVFMIRNGFTFRLVQQILSEIVDEYDAPMIHFLVGIIR